MIDELWEAFEGRGTSNHSRDLSFFTFDVAVELRQNAHDAISELQYCDDSGGNSEFSSHEVETMDSDRAWQKEVHKDNVCDEGSELGQSGSAGEGRAEQCYWPQTRL